MKIVALDSNTCFPFKGYAPPPLACHDCPSRAAVALLSVGLRERKLIFGEAATVALLEPDEERVLPGLGSKNRLDFGHSSFESRPSTTWFFQRYGEYAAVRLWIDHDETRAEELGSTAAAKILEILWRKKILVGQMLCSFRRRCLEL